MISEYKVVYLIIERGLEPNKQKFWRIAGSAFVCRDGSMNLKLDLHPGLTFNIRDPRTNGELQGAITDTWPIPKQSTVNAEDIPF